MMNNLTHAFVVTLLLAVAVPGIGTVAAQQIDCPERQERDVRTTGLDEQTYRRLSRIFEDISDENYSRAYQDATSLRERVRSDYERSEVLLALVVILSQQGRYDEAMTHVREIIRLNALPDRRHYETMYQAAQLNIMQERWREGLNAWEEWYCAIPAEEVNAEAWVFKAQAHSQLNENRAALHAIDRAIEMSDTPNEQWYQFKLGMHLELEEYSPAIQVLRILIQMNPDRKMYWTQMSAIHMRMGNEAEALSVMALAWRRDMFDSQTEYLQLSSLYQSRNVPYKAALVLQEGLEKGTVETSRRHWEMVAGAWYEAREMENALSAYEQAGRHAEDGKIDLQRTYILINREDWDEARASARRAIEKGGLSENERGNAHLLLGMAELEMNNRGAAEQALNQAANYNQTRRAAQEWLRHLRQDRQGQQAPAEPVEPAETDEGSGDADEEG